MLPPIMTKRLALAVAVTLAASSDVDAAPSLSLDRTFVVNGEVRALASDGTTLYLGGTFDSIGQRSGQLALVSSSDGTRDKSIPELGGGEVHAIASDGSGGIFVAGDFRKAGTTRLRGLAHITATGTLDPRFHPSIVGEVWTIACDGTSVYIGGDFSSIDGITRRRLAAFDIATGALTSFDHPVTGFVRSLVIAGPSLYVGGPFQTIDGQARQSLARVDLPAGTLAPWSPNRQPANVQSIVVAGSTIYVGGQFQSLGLDGSVVRNNLAAIDATTASLLPFDANVGGHYYEYVDSLSLLGNTLYVAGSFVGVGGKRRTYAASVDATTGAVTAKFAPSFDGEVFAIHATARSIYLGGATRTAAVDPITGADQTWNPAPSGPVYAIAPFRTGLLLAGAFTSVNAQSRGNLAAIDLTTGRATSWKPRTELGSSISTLQLVGSTVFVGGDFTTMNGQARGAVATVSTSGTLLPFRADADGAVRAIAPVGARLYLGGEFTRIGGQARGHLASVDATTGAVTAWDPGADRDVTDVVVAAGKIFAIGSFASVGGVDRARLVELDASTGAIGPDFGIGGEDLTITSLASDGQRVYVGGLYGRILGTDRTYLSVLDGATSALTSYATHPLDQPEWPVALAVSGQTIYAGNNATGVGVQGYIYAYDRTSGAVQMFAPKPDGNALRMLVLAGRLVMAGNFDAIDGTAQSGIAVFSGTP